MAQAEEQIIRIWDDPESRIQFLETVLGGKGWEAVIYDPAVSGGDGAALADIETQLQSRGYKTARDADEYGQPRLHIRNFGNDTSLADAVGEMGLVKGVGYKLSNIGQPLGKAMHQTKSLFKEMATDKARAIGAFYGLGDVILMFSGLGNKKEGGEQGLAALKDPANALESVFGVAATIQSVIYMAFAKQGSKLALDDLMGKAEQAQANGTNLFDDAAWQQSEKASRFNPFAKVGELLKAKPLEAGAAVQLLGKASMIASGGVRLSREGASKEYRSGAIKDILSAISSGTGWMLTMRKSEKTADEDKLPWSNPGRVWQEVKAEPNRFASAFLAAASLGGVAASYDKGNKIQAIGNSAYIGGDAIMFATKNEEYGELSKGNFAPMVAATKQFMDATPMVLGEAEQEQFVGTLSRYLAERTLAADAKKSGAAVGDAEIAELQAKIQEGLRAELPPVNRQTYEVAGKAAKLVEQFHPAFADQVAGALAEKIAALPGAAITTDELKKHITNQAVAQKDPSTKLIQMKDVVEPIADLAHALPGGASAGTVNALYDAVDELVRPTPRASQQLEDEVNQQAEQSLQTPAQQQGAHQAALAAQRAAQADATPAR